MALSFPREMPEAGIISSPLRLERVDYLSPEQSGRTLAVTAGFPLWRLTVNLQNMLFRDADIWEAWLLSLRGPQKLFYGFDPVRAMPRAHLRTRFQAAPASWSQALAADVPYLSLTGLMPGQVVAVNDHIGFVWDVSKRSLVRSLETQAADALGHVTVAIEPAVPGVTPSNAIVNLRKPTCLMRLVPGESQLPDPTLGYVPAGGRIVAIQDLRE